MDQKISIEIDRVGSISIDLSYREVPSGINLSVERQKQNYRADKCYGCGISVLRNGCKLLVMVNLELIWFKQCLDDQIKSKKQLKNGFDLLFLGIPAAGARACSTGNDSAADAG